MTIDVKGKHVYVTGGGGGLGLAFMRQVVPLGANVSFATKDVVKGAELVKELESIRLESSQKIFPVFGGLNDYTLSQQAIDEATIFQGGNAPDLVFLTAGFAKPGMFLDHDPATLKQGMDDTYWTHAWTAYAAAKAMAKTDKGGDIIFMSSIFSTISYTGYSAVAPAKFAIKGLCDTLKVELEPLGIKTHLFMVSGGFGDNIGKHKPQITQELDAQHGFVKLDPNVEVLKIIKALEEGVDGRI